MRSGGLGCRDGRADCWLPASGQPGQSQHGDVVFLAEALRRAGDRASWLVGNGRGSVESEEFAVRIAGFNHAV